MGAIAGWAAQAHYDEAELIDMLAALAHRAPGADYSAVVDRRRGNEVVMGATSTESGISVALDGAIVNRAEVRGELRRKGYPFKGESDAELLLRAYQYWDKDAVKQLRGAFAFALWDSRKQRLFLARDRFGEKPLYLMDRGEAGLFFASEIKALRKVADVEPDPAAVADTLAGRRLEGTRTLFAGIRKLPAGGSALWQLGRLTEVQYWKLPDGQPVARPEALDIDGFIERLDEAVRLQMDGEEAPGAFLTGGFDSAAIVALMKRHGKRVKTFSAGVEGDRHSELAAAARAAKHFGTEHQELVLQPREVLARLPQVIATSEAPVSRPSEVVLHLLAADAGRSVQVALTGNGADEVLGGYRRYLMKRGESLRGALCADQAGVATQAQAGPLEARAPFLDHRLAEYVSRLPDDARVRGLWTKWILRQAGRRLVPGGEVRPRKAGMRIALGKLLRGEMKEFLVDHLRGPGSQARAWCEPKALDQAIDDHLTGRHNNEGLLWTLLNLEIWHRIHSPSARRA